MKSKLLFVGSRFLVASLASFGLATIANMGDWFAYWEGTIRRVQTVDFNILSHSLPTKLSYLIINNEKEELQRTLNSNYGLFGIVITDCRVETPTCSDQKILYSTESRGKWKQQLGISSLLESPYSLLRNPPPLYSEGGFVGPHEEKWQLRTRIDSGKIIGRVYYIRGIPPTFTEDYLRWLQNPLSVSGAHKDYLITSILFLGFSWATWLLVELLLYRKRVQKHQSQQEKQRLQEKAKNLQKLLKTQIETTSSVVQQRENLAAEVVSIRQDYQQQQERLQDEIRKLEQQLVTQQQEKQVAADKLIELQQDLDATRLIAEGEISQKQAELDALQKRIELYQQEEQKNLEVLEKSRNDLVAAQNNQSVLQTQLSQHEQAINKFRTEIKTYEKLDQENSQLLEWLKHQLANAEEEKVTAQKSLEKQSDIITSLIENVTIQEREKKNKEACLTELQQELAQVQEEQLTVKNQLNAQEQAINLLQRQITLKEKQASEITLALQQRNQDLQEAGLKIEEAQHRLNDIEHKNIQLKNERDEALQKIKTLEDQLLNSSTDQNLLQALEVARAESERLADNYRNRNNVEECYLEMAHQLEQRNLALVAERDDLQYQLWELQERLELYENAQKLQSKALPLSEPIHLDEAKVDLSYWTLAIVGGHPRTRREVIRELCSSYGLRDYREIAPSSEEYIDSHIMRIRLQGCKFIIVITGYIGHDLTNLVSDLRRSGSISGQVVMVNCRGKTGVLREILQHMLKVRS